jgi:hypothetical protein
VRDSGATEPDPAVALELDEADIKGPAVIDAAASGLTHSVSGDHLDPGLSGLGEQAGRCFGAADEDCGIPGERLTSIGRGEQSDQLGRDKGGVSRCARIDLGGGSGKRRGSEALREIHRDRCGARDQRPDQDLDAGDVVGWHGQQPLAQAAQTSMSGVGRGAQCNTRQHCKLGMSRRAGRGDDESEVIWEVAHIGGNGCLRSGRGVRSQGGAGAVQRPLQVCEDVESSNTRGDG